MYGRGIAGTMRFGLKKASDLWTEWDMVGWKEDSASQRLQDNCALLRSKLSWSACEERLALSRRRSLMVCIETSKAGDIDRWGAFAGRALQYNDGREQRRTAQKHRTNSVKTSTLN